MLINFIINVIDTFIIIYLWENLTSENKDMFKFLSSVIILSILVTFIERFGSNFITIYIVDIIIIKVIYRSSLNETILGFILALIGDIGLDLVFSLFIDNLIFDEKCRAIIIELLISIALIVISKTNLIKRSIIFEIKDNSCW